MTSLTGVGLCAEIPSANPNSEQVTYTPIVQMNPVKTPSESIPTSMAAPTQAPDPGLLPGDQASTARIMFNLGLGSPVGLIGGTLTFLSWSQLQTELGLGFGVSGVQFSVMPKLSVGNAQRHFVLGIGPSVGIGQNGKSSPLCVSYWLHAEAGLETRSRSGGSFLLAFGIVRGLAGEMPGHGVIGVTEQGEAVGPERLSDLPIVLPEFRIAWGQWF